MKILIVDDVLENRILLNSFLKSYGYCDLVDNGTSAVVMFVSGFEEEEPYDLILLDIAMPGMDGQEILRRMREIERENGVTSEEQTPIIMVTAVDATTEVAEAFQGGCTGYLNKPISRAKLLVKLSELGLISSDWWKENR
ncbi:MAG: response regulator [Magnetococcales bacterium]|nr:response regulator [Magnetococcales bacterium]